MKLLSSSDSDLHSIFFKEKFYISVSYEVCYFWEFSENSKDF